MLGLTARIVLIAALLLAIWSISTQFKVTTDLGVFLPAITTSAEKILIKQLGKGATSKLLFAAIAGGNEQKLRQVNKSLAEEVRKSEHFARVLNGEHDLNQADRDLIFGYRYLIAPLDVKKGFSVEGLRQALQDRFRGLASSTAAFEKSFLVNDPVGASKLFIDQLLDNQDDTGPLRIDNVWMSRDRERSLMILEMHSDAFDIDGQSAALAAFKQAFQSLDTTGLTLAISGPGAFTVEARDTIRADVRLLTILAVVFVAGFLFLAFRSLMFLLLVTVPLFLGVVVAIGSVLLVFGSIHGITLAFGVTLTGVAVDYPIHLVSHLPGTDVGARQHVKRIWPTLRLGVITTVIAYASLILSDFNGLTQLGVFTVTGLLTAAAVTRWLLPHIIPKRVALQHGMKRSHAFLERAGRRAPQARVWATLLVILASTYLVLLDRPLRDDRLDSLSPIPEQRRAEDKSLRTDLGMWSGAKLLAIIAPDAESALRKSEELMPRLDSYVEQGLLDDYDAAAQYLPSVHLQLQRQSELPRETVLRRRLGKALEGLPFKDDIFEPFIADVEQIKQVQPATLDTLKQTNLVPLLSPLLFELDDKWVAPILLHGVTDAGRFQLLDQNSNGVETAYLDLKQASNDVMLGAMDHVLRLLGWGALFIYLVLAFNFKNVRKPLYILIPTVAAVIMVTAILVLSGIQLTVFHLVSLLLVVGLGLDYALFFNRLTHSENEWTTTFKSLWVCCVTTVLVFGMLLLSHTPPLQAVGLTVSIGRRFVSDPLCDLVDLRALRNKKKAQAAVPGETTRCRLTVAACSHDETDIPGVLCCALAASPARGDELPLWEIALGGGLLTVPEYRGSQENKLVPFPIVYPMYRGRFFRIDDDGVRGVLYESRKFEFDFSVDANTKVTSDPDSPRAGMPDLDPTVQVGPLLTYKVFTDTAKRNALYVNAPVRSVFSVSFDNIDQVGYTFSPHLTYYKWFDFFDREWRMGLSGGLEFGDEGFHDYYYQVKPEFATPTRSAYDASAGFGGTRFILTLISRTNKSWISLFARYDRFDDAVFNDSPLVERGWGVTLGFVYSRFTFRSKQKVEVKQRGKQE